MKALLAILLCLWASPAAAYFHHGDPAKYLAAGPGWSTSSLEPDGTTACNLSTAFLQVFNNLSNGDTITIGAKVYTIQTVLTDVDGHVARGSSKEVTLNNFFCAVTTACGTPGTTYAASQTADTLMTTSRSIRDVGASPAAAGYLVGLSAGVATTPTKSASNLVITAITDACPTPANQGDPADYSYTENTEAAFDQPQFQTVTSTFHFGVVAFHSIKAGDPGPVTQPNMDHVSCSADGGAWTTVTTPGTNPDTGISDPVYVFALRPVDFTDKTVEVRCIAFPKVGVPRVLQDQVAIVEALAPALKVNTNASGSLAGATRYVDGTSGNDANDCLTAGTACATMEQAGILLKAALGGSSLAGGVIKLEPFLAYCLGGTGAAPTCSGSSATVPFATLQWFTVMPDVGVDPSTVKITGEAGCTVRPLKTKILNVRMDHALSACTSTNLNSYTWRAGSNCTLAASTISGSCGGDFVTDSTVGNSFDGTPSALLVRNETIDTISSDALSGTRSIIHAAVTNINNAPYTFTATATSGSPIFTGVSNFTQVGVGSLMVCTGFTGTSTTVSAVDAGAGTITVSTNATANGSINAASICSTGAHPDVYQARLTIPVRNGIIYNLTTTGTIKAQCLFTDGNPPYVDFAAVGFSCNNAGSGEKSLQMRGTGTTNLFLSNDQLLGGGSTWNTNSSPGPAFTAVDVLLLNDVFQTCPQQDNGSTTPPAGVTTRNVTVSGGGSCP